MTHKLSKRRVPLSTVRCRWCARRPLFSSCCFLLSYCISHLSLSLSHRHITSTFGVSTTVHTGCCRCVHRAAASYVVSYTNCLLFTLRAKWQLWQLRRYYCHREEQEREREREWPLKVEGNNLWVSGEETASHGNCSSCNRTKRTRTQSKCQ